MSKVLKKLQNGNPLENFHLWEELQEYSQLQSDQEMADFYHKILTRYEERPLVIRFIYAMISFSVSHSLSTFKTEI